MTIAEWNALKIGDTVVTEALNSNFNRRLNYYDVMCVRPRQGLANFVTLYSYRKQITFSTSDFNIYDIEKKTAKPKAPQVIHYEPRAVVSWCPEEVADKLGISPADGAQFLSDIEDELEEAMTNAGWEFIVAKAKERGWEEVER